MHTDTNTIVSKNKNNDLNSQQKRKIKCNVKYTHKRKCTVLFSTSFQYSGKSYTSMRKQNEQQDKKTKLENAASYEKNELQDWLPLSGWAKFAKSVERHRLVTISPWINSVTPLRRRRWIFTFSKLANVLSLNGSGRQARRASRALTQAVRPSTLKLKCYTPQVVTQP